LGNNQDNFQLTDKRQKVSEGYFLAHTTYSISENPKYVYGSCTTVDICCCCEWRLYHTHQQNTIQH